MEIAKRVEVMETGMHVLDRGNDSETIAMRRGGTSPHWDRGRDGKGQGRGGRQNDHTQQEREGWGWEASSKMGKGAMDESAAGEGGYAPDCKGLWEARQVPKDRPEQRHDGVLEHHPEKYQPRGPAQSRKILGGGKGLKAGKTWQCREAMRATVCLTFASRDVPIPITEVAKGKQKSLRTGS